MCTANNVLNPKLEMLSQREQLMIDIDLICDGWLSTDLPRKDIDDLVRTLCDAVCENFPSN